MRPFVIALIATVIAPMVNGAMAHPHLWVTIETTVLYDRGTFTGLRQKWTFDEFYTAFAIEGLDKNHDGVYDREELAELAKVNIEGLKEFHYFTYPLLAGKEIKLKDAQDYWLEHKDGVLSLLFTVLFDQPILPDAADFAFVVEDPTYYIAFVPAKVDAVKLGEGAPNSCKARVGRRSDDAEAEQLAKAFAQLAIRVAAQSVVSVDCKGH
jgi:ABC-type uncharacterized transport system substrate-binding protein